MKKSSSAALPTASALRTRRIKDRHRILCQRGFYCSKWPADIKERMKNLPPSFLNETFFPRALHDRLTEQNYSTSTTGSSTSSMNNRHLAKNFPTKNWKIIALNKTEKTHPTAETKNDSGGNANRKTQMMMFGSSSIETAKRTNNPNNYTPYEIDLEIVLQQAIGDVIENHAYQTLSLSKPRKKRKRQRKRKAKAKEMVPEVSGGATNALANTHVVSSAHLRTPITQRPLPNILTPNLATLRSMNVIEYWEGQKYDDTSAGKLKEHHDWVRLKKMMADLGAQYHHRDFDQKSCRQGM